ncbi:MAG: heterodisulfide reductase subunit, partial [Thermodesulfobacteriota bacterium]|nr:heterodisulfide reductase subunit [Thermodesulfobacteriota bacterium]
DKLGLNKDRLRLAWVSAAEGAQFAKVIKEMEQGLRELTPDQVLETKQKLAKRVPRKGEPV